MKGVASPLVAAHHPTPQGPSQQDLLLDDTRWMCR
jgi:hypothetical protein